MISFRDAQRALLSSDTSRVNKLHLAIGWTHRYGWPIAWRWEGDFMRSRLLFQFAPDEPFSRAKSFEEDVLPTFDMSEGKNS